MKIRDWYDLIRLNEGCSLKLYKDGRGIPTIGIGRNLVDVGISVEECTAMFSADTRDAECVAGDYPWFATLDPVRQAVVVDMAFDLGAQGLAGFFKWEAAMEAHRWPDASAEILDSAWARFEDPARAKRDAAMIMTGEWPDEDDRGDRQLIIPTKTGAR